MGYIKTRADYQCDFCGLQHAVPLDGIIVQGETFARGMAEQAILDSAGDHGMIFKDGDIYACQDCWDTAVDSLPPDGDSMEEVLEWLDDNR